MPVPVPEPATPAPGAAPAESAASSRLFRSAALIGGLTAVSRVLGLVRDMLQAALLGAGTVADAFVIAWTLPNLARRVFGEGALTAAFLPVFQRVRERDGEARALRLTGRVLLLLVGGLGGAALLASGVALLLRGRATGGLGADAAKADLTLTLAAILLPYTALVCGTALLVATWNGLQRFGRPALPPIVQNLAWIAGLAACAGTADVAMRAYGVAVAALVGGLAGLALLLVPLWRRGMPLRAALPAGDADVHAVGRLFWPVVFGLGIVQLNVLCDRAIAEVCIPGDGGVAALYYGHQLMELPMGVISVAVATAAFPGLATLGARQDWPGLGAGLARALRLVAAIAFPAAIGLAVAREPVVELLFQRGRFDAEASARAAGVTLFYALAVAPASLLPVLARGHHARADTRTPVRIGVACVGVNLALNLALVWPLREAGLAAATAIATTVQTAWLAAALRRHVPIAWRTDVWPALRRAGLASALSGLAAAGALAAASAWGPASGTAAAATRTGAAVAAGIAAYLVAARACGVVELGRLLRRG